jgi:hypothetical protein
VGFLRRQSPRRTPAVPVLAAISLAAAVGSLAGCAPLRHMASSEAQTLEHRGVSVTIYERNF